MKKTIKLLALGLLFPIIAHAQESVGFSETDNIQPLLDYRLPAWGYSNFFLDFSLAGDFASTDASGLPIQAQSLDQFSGQFSPVYTRFRESEPRISSYTIRPDFEYKYNKTEATDTGEETEYTAGLNWSLNEQLYFNESDLFFIGRNNGDFSQNRFEYDYSSETSQTSESELNRRFTTRFSAGLGYGRLRNVNPVIRSLRLNERLNALEVDQQMGQNDIFQAAEHFTTYNGYQAAYDRPQKQFWGDMDQRLTADLASLNAFDLLYLTDVLKESIGQRREGWQVMAIVGLQYSVDYFDSDDTDSELSKDTYLTPQILGEWSKNVSLNHQFRLQGSYQYLLDIGSESSGNDSGSFSAGAQWLYTVTDRFLVNTAFTFNRMSRSNSSLSGNLYHIRSNFNYFLEDRVSLFGSVNYTYSSASISFKNLQFNAGVRYYLRRQLF